jgi:phosphopantetheinyl transferase (holo-ACP synthase)
VSAGRTRGEQAACEVRSYLAMVPVAHAKRYRSRWLRRYFTLAEARDLTTRPAQSLAGAVALKRAVKRLIRELAPRRRIGELSIGVGHARDGAPALTRVPAVGTRSGRALLAALHVSVTHTARNAYGVVACAYACRARSDRIVQ